MNGPLDAALERELAAARARGEPVALAAVVEGEGAGRRILIWRGGEAIGDLGSPRLNQRVALYAEGLIERGGRERKRFVTPAGEVLIEATVIVGDGDA